MRGSIETPRRIGISRCEAACGTTLPRTGVPYAACYAHAPLAQDPESCRGRSLCERLKRADPATLAHMSVEVWRQVRGLGRFGAFFGRDVVLIPVPSSGCSPGPIWVGGQLAQCLRELALARAVWPGLRRRHPVRKSATAAPGQRPSVGEHYASLRVVRPWVGGRSAAPARIVLVDDVVTRGRTLLAATVRVREAFPASQIRAFALMYTLQRGVGGVARTPDPCEGEVLWSGDDARRIP